MRQIGLDHDLPDARRFGDRLRAALQRRALWAPTVRLPKHSNLYTCGQPDNNLYLIESGQVKAVTLARCGKECLIGIYTPQDIVGESCLLGGERPETATAMLPTVLRRIPRGQFLEFLVSEGLLEDFLSYLALRLSEQQQIITHLVTVDSEQRLAATLLRLGRKLGHREAGRLRIDQKITQEELAEMVGTTRSRVGYFLKRFRDAGLIETAPGSYLCVHEHRLGEYLEARS